MLTKRIIPCLDIKDGRTVKGVKFKQLTDKGCPVELATRYAEEGADELVLLDVSATLEGRLAMQDVVKRVAAALNIPFTVGGGIRNIDDAIALLDVGADKISINSAVVENPKLITELANQCGTQAIVVAIDTLRDGSIFTRSATAATGVNAIEWAKEACDRGAGELLVTAIEKDGVRDGFDCSLMRQISDVVSVPVIASGGAGTVQDFEKVFKVGNVEAALAAGIFHDRFLTIGEVKEYLKNVGIEVRL